VYRELRLVVYGPSLLYLAKDDGERPIREIVFIPCHVERSSVASSFRVPTRQFRPSIDQRVVGTHVEPWCSRSPCISPRAGALPVKSNGHLERALLVARSKSSPNALQVTLQGIAQFLIERSTIRVFGLAQFEFVNIPPSPHGFRGLTNQGRRIPPTRAPNNPQRVETSDESGQPLTWHRRGRTPQKAYRSQQLSQMDPPRNLLASSAFHSYGQEAGVCNSPVLGPLRHY